MEPSCGRIAKSSLEGGISSAAETSAMAISSASLMLAGGSRHCSLVESSSSVDVSGDGAGRLAAGVGVGVG